MRSICNPENVPWTIVLTRLGYEAYLLKACPDGAQQIANLEQLQAIAARYAHEQDGVLGEFLVQAGLGH